jgi:hypothetical protein
MSLSTETLVAAFLAIVFGVLSLGVIAREQGQRAPASTNHPALSYVSAARSGSLSGSGANDVVGFY